jgi:tetratricopeptide (TPR) repeat protein
MLRAGPQRAIGTLREGLRIEPHDVALREALVGALLHIGDFDAAAAEQRLVVEEKGGAPHTRVFLAGILLEKRDYDGGIAELKATIAKYPEFAPAHAQLALVFQRLGKPDEARPYFERAEALDPMIFQRMPH